ncbi:SH3 domain-containing kinase-binding protein 1 [Trichogramma pretiosum]|uniref:SH3 domain-containing kinase-binding protein 1 n=1 Tax=Trichogramma pretiosum TaxID=7493 RepID=UPI0006C93CD9|nr:SH3 domain-containing kinase-binding protein 1 [Trichogramma pretiosum]
MEALVEFNYDARQPDELTIKKGDVIKDVTLLHGGWWEGTLKEKRGMFPDNFVTLIKGTGPRNSEDKTEMEEVALRNGSGRKLCRVLFSYDPCNDDELKLIRDEHIEYLGEVEEGWWKGRIKGKVGVFPSNFVAPPYPEKKERIKDNKKELCKALFAYEAVNEDELTLKEGDIITLLSRDAPDKGWWKGELRGQIGLFPDNFVQVMTSKIKNQTTEEHANDISPIKLVNQSGGRKKETANVRRSLDPKNLHSDGIVKKLNSPTPPSNSLNVGNNSLDTQVKKLSNDSSFMDVGSDNNGTSTSNNGNGSYTTSSDLVEELDEVERSEGSTLSHLTASRAKAPRRRLPTTQHLRNHNPTINENTSNNISPIKEDNITNGNAEVLEDNVKNDVIDTQVAKTRKKAPWVEELKLNQMERKKGNSDLSDSKIESKKERSFEWSQSAGSPDVSPKLEINTAGSKLKDKGKSNKSETTSSSEQSLLTPSSPLPLDNQPYVPFHLYMQLKDQVKFLERTVVRLQDQVSDLTKQLEKIVRD